MTSIKVNDGYAMKLFPRNEQQAVIRMAFKNNKQKFKMSNNQ